MKVTHTQNLLAAALVGALAFIINASAATAPTPDEARAIAEEAFIYAHLPIQGYQTLYNQTQNAEFPGYVGGFGRYRHYTRVATPADRDIVTPNNDTPYSYAWLDLRREPYVLMPLSEFAGLKPPPVPAIEFPAWDEKKAMSAGFIGYLIPAALLTSCRSGMSMGRAELAASGLLG